jgi:hypothetical protein
MGEMSGRPSLDLQILTRVSRCALESYARHLSKCHPHLGLNASRVEGALARAVVRATATAKQWGDWNSIKSTVLGTVPPVDENLGKP